METDFVIDAFQSWFQKWFPARSAFGALLFCHPHHSPEFVRVRGHRRGWGNVGAGGGAASAGDGGNGQGNGGTKGTSEHRGNDVGTTPIAVEDVAAVAIVETSRTFPPPLAPPSPSKHTKHTKHAARTIGGGGEEE